MLAQHCAAGNKDHVHYLLRLCELELIERVDDRITILYSAKLIRIYAKFIPYFIVIQFTNNEHDLRRSIFIWPFI
jgi:hypothetical protein